MNHVNTQYNFNLSHPESLGIKCSRTLRLEHRHQLSEQLDKIELGVWHILPASSLAACATNDNRTSPRDDRHAFSDSRPIVLYVHGNGGSRASDHRGRLYRRLAYEHDYHIVTFDYRGYADSTYESPTAFGLTSDARFMYDWLLQQPGVSQDRLIVWGHSLGTAVAVRMMADLPAELAPRRLVLEAPFDSLANAIANHPFSTPFRLLPYFEHFFVEPIQKSPELNFDSAKRIGDIRATPIMILHAEDDAIIPLKLGEQLYQTAVARLGKARVKFLQIATSHQLGHKHICMHDETMLKVKQFIGAER